MYCCMYPTANYYYHPSPNSHYISKNLFPLNYNATVRYILTDVSLINICYYYEYSIV